MQKTAPKPASLAIMIVFALSCAGILIFLWTSFGGSIPLAPNSYELKVAFPQAINVAPNADVRIAGVTVGHVRSEKLDEPEHRTLMTLSIDHQFAPVPAGTHAILRHKTLLGETYVELTPGPPGGAKLPDGGRIANSQVQSTVELDQILGVFDPQTKQLFRELVRNGAQVLRGRGQDLSDALGNLPEFAGTGSALLGVLHRHSVALRGLVRNTGAVFAALNRRSGELQQLILNSNNLFSATQQERGALATIFEIFPTFLDESRTTLARLRTFSSNADPVVNAFKPIADELRPVLPDARALAPPLNRLFSTLPPLISAARPNIPQAVRFLRGLPPLFAGLNAFLPELNPILSFANWQQHVFGQFIAGPGSGVAPLPPLTAGGPMRQYLRQFGAIDDHSVSLQPTQQSWMRGNAYNAPNAYTRALYLGAVESFTCAPAGGPQRDPDPSKSVLPCFLAPKSLWDNRIFPHVNRGQAPLLRPPSDLAGNSVVPTNLPPFAK